MPRTVIAAGLEAVRKAAGILAAGDFAKSQGLALAPGVQWGADRMLLSMTRASVWFVVGSTLYSQDREGFLLAEFPPGSHPPRRPSWLQGLSPYEMPLCLSLASELAPGWPIASANAFLEQFSHFYRNHRTRIEQAVVELRYIADGLLLLQHWPTLLEGVLEAMGPPARWIVPKGSSHADLGAFLGRLLLARDVALDRVPACLRAMEASDSPESQASLRMPHYRRMIEKLGRSAEAVAPLIEQMRAESKTGPF